MSATGISKNEYTTKNCGRLFSRRKTRWNTRQRATATTRYAERNIINTGENIIYGEAGSRLPVSA